MHTIAVRATNKPRHVLNTKKLNSKFLDSILTLILSNSILLQRTISALATNRTSWINIMGICILHCLLLWLNMAVISLKTTSKVQLPLKGATKEVKTWQNKMIMHTQVIEELEKAIVASKILVRLLEHAFAPLFYLTQCKKKNFLATWTTIMMYHDYQFILCFLGRSWNGMEEILFTYIKLPVWRLVCTG